MPRVILLLFILGLVAVAIRQVAAALASPGGGTGPCRPDLPERPRGYPALRERKARLLAAIAEAEAAQGGGSPDRA